jgi:hypothetical protein
MNENGVEKSARAFRALSRGFWIILLDGRGFLDFASANFASAHLLMLRSK